MAKYAILIIVVIIYAWCIMVTMPYRREVITAYSMNNHTGNLERDVAYAKAEYDSAKMSDPDSESTLSAGERLAVCYWEKKEPSKAVEVIDEVMRKRRELNPDAKYNEKFISTLLIYAGVLRDVGNYASAEGYYQEVYEYDKKFLESSDPDSEKIARDLNNLGLFSYMKATSEADEAARSALLTQASEYLNQAIKKYQAKLGKDSASESTSLWNLFFVERDRGNKSLANSLKRRAEAIDKKLSRLKAP